MDWLKGRVKAETQKYQQKILGSASSDSHKESSQHSSGAQSRHFDPRDCYFDVNPNPHHNHNHSTPHSPPNIRIKSITPLGNTTSLTTHTVRDLGFTGRLGPHILLSYGDTIYTDSKLNSTPFRGMTSNSVALATHNPCHVVDTNLNPSSQYPEQFARVDPAWGEDISTHAVGITNVVETKSTSCEGIVYTLLNHRADGTDHLLGAGIATVTLEKRTDSALPVPVANRLSPYIWDGATEPWYGDVGAINTRGFIYAYGHKKDNPWVYLARVKVEDALRVECYEYWHGTAKGWMSERLVGDSVGEEQSVFWQVNQGQVVWSAYFHAYLFIYCDNFWSSTLLLRSAPNPEGPWSDVINMHKCTPITEGGNVYAAVPHPYLDESGKTLVVTFTNHPNCIQGVRVEFE